MSATLTKFMATHKASDEVGRSQDDVIDAIVDSSICQVSVLFESLLNVMRLQTLSEKAQRHSLPTLRHIHSFCGAIAPFGPRRTSVSLALCLSCFFNIWKELKD